jgi:hypothetical protein
MTLKKAFLLLSSMLLTGCMMAPAHQDPRWTDDALAAQPPGDCACFRADLRLSEDERTALQLHEADVLAAVSLSWRPARPCAVPTLILNVTLLSSAPAPNRLNKHRFTPDCLKEDSPCPMVSPSIVLSPAR